MTVESGCGCQGGGKRSIRKTARRGRKAPSSRAKKLYRKRVKGSKCRGMMTAKCRHSKKCKMALGKKRSFCRKAGNTKRPRYNLRSRRTMKGGKNDSNEIKTGLSDHKGPYNFDTYNGKTGDWATPTMHYQNNKTSGITNAAKTVGNSVKKGWSNPF